MWENTDQKIFKYGRSSRSADSVYFQVNIFDLKNILQGQKANFEIKKSKRKTKRNSKKKKWQICFLEFDILFIYFKGQNSHISELHMLHLCVIFK